MRGKQKMGFFLSIFSMLTVLILCGCSFAGAAIPNSTVGANNQVQKLESTSTFLSGEQNIKSIDIQATVGNLTILYGTKPQIEIGGKLINHASFSNDNGMIIYRDDFGKGNLSFDDITNNEEYKIAITIPNNLEIETLSVDVGIGSINIQNIMADDATVNGTTKINLDEFQSTTLELNSTLADISADNITVLKKFSLYSYGSTAIVSGDMKGDVLIDSAGISNTDITFNNSDQSDYFITSTWEPESKNKEPGNFALESARLLINGEKYSIEYTNSNSRAPYTLKVLSRELIPMENIKISFIE